MAGRRHCAGGTHGTLRSVLVVWLAGLLTAAGCAAPPRPPVTPGIRLTLDRWGAALRDRDETAFLAALDPTAAELRETELREFGNLAEVPLSSWEYRLTGVHLSGGTATVRADLRYRIAGYDSAPVSTPRALELEEHHDRWYVTADRPGEGGSPQLWEQGAVQLVRGTHSLVLGVGRSDAWLRQAAAVADLAVPAVDAAWPGRWARRVLLLVPGSLDSMARLLGSTAAAYRGIAAVTTGETGGSGVAPADRVIVNPEAFGGLSGFGQRVVLTHETTHVATRAATSPATPVWLSEGFADWVAYRGRDMAVAKIAPELQRAVRSGQLPTALPADEDFAFTGGAGRLARAYQGGWLACDLIADHWGEHRLAEFYQAVGAHGQREGALEQAMHDVLSTTPDDFTAQWRAYLRNRLG